MMSDNEQSRKILLLAANPRGSSRLRLNEEVREIKEGLKRSKYRDKYSIAKAEAVRYRDIHRAILEYEPQIVHFSGHGSGEDGLLFEDESGEIKLVGAEALAGLFQLFAEQVECVVLNACYSKYQALEIARHIDYVVGMSQEIGDRSAIEFSVGFYDALGANKCLLLRGWYETAKQGDKIGNIWKKLRLVVVHSTEAYPALDTNHSPFNVGELIELPEFNLQQVKTLAKQYELNGQLGEQGACELMELIGGHPYLLQQAITSLRDTTRTLSSANAHLNNQQVTLEELLRIAPTEQGIFSNHLRQQLWKLQHNSSLELGYKQVVVANVPVQLDTEVAFKLHSLGLVKLSGNDCVPSCELYRHYFSKRLG